MAGTSQQLSLEHAKKAINPKLMHASKYRDKHTDYPMALALTITN